METHLFSGVYYYVNLTSVTTKRTDQRTTSEVIWVKNLLVGFLLGLNWFGTSVKLFNCLCYFSEPERPITSFRDLISFSIYFFCIDFPDASISRERVSGRAVYGQPLSVGINGVLYLEGVFRASKPFNALMHAAHVMDVDFGGGSARNWRHI